MEELTIRNIEPDLAAALQQTALREQVSFEQAALDLLLKGAGLQQQSVGNQLNHFIGDWSDKDAYVFSKSVVGSANNNLRPV